MQRKFLGNLLLLQALNWLIKPVWIFWIERMVQINLGDDWYGRYFVVFNFGLLFNILLDFGLNSYVSTTVAKSGNPAVIKPVLRLRVWLALVYVILVATLGSAQGFDSGILIMVILNQFLAGMVLFLRAVLQGRHLFKTDSIVSVTDRAIALVLCAFFIYNFQFTGRQGVLYFLYAQSIGYAVAVGIAAWFAFRRSHPVAHENIENTPMQMLLKQTAWFAVLAFAMSVFTRIDAVMIRNLSEGGYAEAGSYARSFRLLDAALIFSSLISTMLLPVFAKLIADKKSTDAMAWLNMRIVLLVAVPACMAALYFGPPILHILYSGNAVNSPENIRLSSIFGPLMACFIPMALVHVFGTWLTAAHRVKYLSMLAMICMLFNIGINFILIPRFGAEGAAWSCLSTQMVFALGCIVFAYKLGAIQINNRRILQLIMWVSLTSAAFAICQIWMPGLPGLFAALLAYAAITFFSGIFWEEFKKLKAAFSA